MLSDERLEKVERFVSESLNEDASLKKKVFLDLSDFDQGELTSSRVRQELALPMPGCTP